MVNWSVGTWDKRRSCCRKLCGRNSRVSCPRGAWEQGPCEHVHLSGNGQLTAREVKGP